MFGIIKKILIGLLSSIVNASNHTKCVSLSNQKCMIQPTLLIYTLMNTVKTLYSEAVTQRCSWGNVFWKHAANEHLRVTASE